MAPSLAWIAMDRSVWPWDQAWFGFHTVALYEALRDGPSSWLPALAAATPWKPPAVAWIGHLFVPLGMALGSVDAGLLASVWATHLLALLLLFRALTLLCGGRVVPAVAGVLAVAAAPIFATLSTQYMAEAAQTLAVAWFVLIAAAAPRWSRARIAAQLVAATAFAMLAKTTSPLYCAAPGLLALAELARSRPPTSTRDRGAWGCWAAATVLAFGAVAWYAENLDAVSHHARAAAFGPVAELYGGRSEFLAGLLDRCAAALRVTTLPLTAAGLLAAAFLGALPRRIQAWRQPPARLTLFAAAALAQVALALLVMALSPNRDPRYVAPLLPLAAVVVTWAVAHAWRPAAAAVAAALLALQLVLVQAQLLGWHAPWPPIRVTGLDPALSRPQHDARAATTLRAIVARTCSRGGFGGVNMVGVDLLRLNGHAATYAAGKERLAGRAGTCRYDSLGFQPLFVGQRTVKVYDYVYWIHVDPAVYPIPPEVDFLNQTAPMLFRQLRRRGRLQPEPWNGPPGITLYRFAKR